jgi:chromate transporter
VDSLRVDHGDEAGGPLRSVLRAVLQASTLHVGGTATATWLRDTLVTAGRLTVADFNRCFAAARLTPGTNLLAFYTAVGHHVARWRGAIAALAIGTVVPAAMAVALTMLYLRFAAQPAVDRLMAGAQAGAVAVIIWTALRLLVATAAERPWRGAAVAAGAALAMWSALLPPVIVLLLAAAAGSIVLREAA